MTTLSPELCLRMLTNARRVLSDREAAPADQEEAARYLAAARQELWERAAPSHTVWRLYWSLWAVLELLEAGKRGPAVQMLRLCEDRAREWAA